MCVCPLPLQDAIELKEPSADIRHGLPHGQLMGPVPLQTGLEAKVSPSHQALLQHLLQKEQMRQQKILSSGEFLLLIFSFPVVKQSVYCFALKLEM